MKTDTKRAKDRRGFRLEFLEDRNLLSAGAGLARPPGSGVAAEVSRARAVAPVSSITGQVSGQMATAGLYAKVFAGEVSFSGHGRATSVGNVLFGAEHAQTSDTSTNPPRLTISTGRGLLTTYHGDQITVVYNGQGTVSRGGRVSLGLNGFVTGGTGRFLGASGTFAGTVTGSASGRIHVGFALTFNPPR